MQQRRRLNLFAFTPETNALFSMLILDAIMLALFFGNVYRIYSGSNDPFDSVDITARGLELTSAVIPILGLSSIATIGTLCLALFLYFRHPSQIRQQRKLRQLTEKDLGIQAHTTKLALQVGLDPPIVEMPPQGLKGSDAQAFGVGRMQAIALDGGFRILRKTRPDVFNALLHHELAHFANNDIWRSYFSIALWKAIRWLLVFPFLLGLITIIFSGLIFGLFEPRQFELALAAIPGAFILFIQWGFMLYVSGMIWARLLRTRELYADWRAAIWGSQKGLQEILQEETEKERPKSHFRLWNYHPDARQRLEALERPEKFFNLSPTFVFLTGLLLSFIFSGLYFSFAAFFAFAGTILSIRDASTGLMYWLARGIWWFGFASLILLVFGSIAWLINGALLPQIQKQVTFELMHKQRGVMQYGKLGISALLFVAGMELGFFATPFDIFAPNNPLGLLIEFLIVGPVFVCLAWWYLAYIRFITLRLLATQTGRTISVWRSRFIKTTSSLWVFFFFVPGILLSRLMDGSFREVFISLNVSWLAFTIFLSPIIFVVSWITIKLVFDNPTQKCPSCGKITKHAAPAVERCEHCEGVLGEWLFIPEQA